MKIKNLIMIAVICFGISNAYGRDNVVVSNVKIMNGNQPIEVKINTLTRGFDDYFHLKGICNFFNINFVYSSFKKKVIITKNGKSLVIYINKDTKLPQKPVFIRKKLFVSRDSLVFILKSILNTEVSYDKRNKHLIIKRLIPVVAQGSKTLAKKDNEKAVKFIEGKPFKVNKIIIDPGHGGKDPGAVGKSGLLEKDCTLSIAIELSKLITEKLKKEVVLTRNKDVYVSLPERANIANKRQGDVFVSIHINADTSRKTSGTEVYIYGYDATDEASGRLARRENLDNYADRTINSILIDMEKKSGEELGIMLAGNMEDSLVEELKTEGRNNKKILRAPFFVLANTKMPAVLVEVAFITNPEEEKKLKEPAFINKAALALFNGLSNFIETTGVSNIAKSTDIPEK